jgi:hypothetical protein
MLLQQGKPILLARGCRRRNETLPCRDLLRCVTFFGVGQPTFSRYGERANVKAVALVGSEAKALYATLGSSEPHGTRAWSLNREGMVCAAHRNSGRHRDRGGHHLSFEKDGLIDKGRRSDFRFEGNPERRSPPLSSIRSH